MLKKSSQKAKGFTLVELMIVIAIIGILAAIAIPQYDQFRKRGYMAMTRSDAKNAHTAMQGWMTDHINTAPPADSLTGPGRMAVYVMASVSRDVTISVAAGGDVTATHAQLNGSIIITRNGAVTDTLAP